uniref:Uncharacterized protein n=1 Tax=Arundo donax TaxID=35708 RepID=A0A0A8ZIU3_ARUDO
MQVGPRLTKFPGALGGGQVLS